MSSGRLCGFTPITFCRKISRLQVARGLALKRLIKGKHEFRRTATSKNNVEKKKKKEIKRTVSQISSVAEASPKSFNSTKHVSTSGGAASPISVKYAKKKVTTSRKNILDGSSPKCTANFILMVELRKNIFAFRNMIDLPSLDGSLSVAEIITQTMKDLQKLSPEIVHINQSFEMEGADMDKMLIFFYEDLRAIGDSWIMDSDWIYRSKYKNTGVGKNKSDRLVEHVLAALDGLIKTTRERFGMMDLESDGRKSFTPKDVSSDFTRSASYSESNNSFYPSPLTPRSVLPGTMLMSSNSTSPSLWNLRAQALDKLSPVGLKRFAMQILSQRDSESVNEMKIGIEENNEESDKFAEKDEEEEEEEDNDSSVLETEKHDIKTEDHREGSGTEHETEAEHKINGSEAEHKINGSEAEHEIEAENHINGSDTEPEIQKEHHHMEGFETEDHSETTTSETNSIESSQNEDSVTQSPPPPPLPSPQSPSPTVSMLNKKSTLLSQPPPPPPSPQSENKAPAPPPPPPKSKPSKSRDFCQFPKSQSINGDNASSMPAPPEPPGSGRSLRAKKATSKLRRSAQIANLYWVLKGKLEGRGVEGKTTKANKGQKNAAEKSPVKGARSGGMADALAEMTKRSSYFQHIEEDVQKYAQSIEELKSSIHSFQTKDMKELLEFHSKVESVLEKLTDETQVLGRFEGFPEKKLEAIRTAGALYKKLDGILVELKNWKIEPPLNDLLDKIERYFNKFKGEIETVERTKDEDAKMFQKHNINIDFEVLVQVKETMVDVSSNCMELALKERREANEEAKNSEESKMNNMKAERAKRLWRAFQFAFKVYTFAGGHDERADCLTRQLAHEIQTDPADQTDSSIMS